MKILPITASLMLASLVAVPVFSCHKKLSQEKMKLTFSIPDGSVQPDGQTAATCGAQDAQCGSWTCASGSPQNCVTYQTACVYVNDGGPQTLCGNGDLPLHCCPYPQAGDGAACTNWKKCGPAGDSGNPTDASLAADGSHYCGPNVGGCSGGGMELSNAVLGSAASGGVPGGVFCPGVNFAINILADPNNCGKCGNKCVSGLSCQGGYCYP